MSPGLAIVLIIVVWLLVLAPVLLRGQKPMSRTGEAFEDTRVLFEGDSGALEATRGPKLSAKAARIKARKEANAAGSDAGAETTSDEATIEEPAKATAQTEAADKSEKQTIAGAAARIKSEYDSADAEMPASTGTAVADAANAADASEEAETIEGEIVYEVELSDAEAEDKATTTSENMVESADIVDAEFTDAEPVEVSGESKDETSADTKAEPANATPVNAVLIDDDAELLDEEDDILLEDEPREKAAVKNSEKSKAETVSASECQVFTAPAAYKLADDAYDMDDSFISPVDMMYPGAVDAELDQVEPENTNTVTNTDTAEVAQDNAADEEAEQPSQRSAEVAEYGEEFEEEYLAADADSELSEEELEFAQARVGRGGWDPEADAASTATRYQRRQRTLLGLAGVVVLTVALGIIFGGWLWWTAAIAGGLTIAYLVALRTQVRQEQQLRARRIAQLRRARLGVRSAQDEELAIPRSLRRPGAVIVEIDDSSPDWDHLPEMYEEVEEVPDHPSSRRQRRDDLAARRVG